MKALSAWLTSCIDEDEAVARAVDLAPQRPVMGDTKPRPVEWYSMRVAYATEDGYPKHYQDEARTKLADRFDPAQALAEVMAKRTILALCDKVDQLADCVDQEFGTRDEPADDTGDRIRRALAEVYSDRAGYRQAITGQGATSPSPYADAAEPPKPVIETGAVRHWPGGREFVLE